MPQKFRLVKQRRHRLIKRRNVADQHQRYEQCEKLVGRLPVTPIRDQRRYKECEHLVDRLPVIPISDYQKCYNYCEKSFSESPLASFKIFEPTRSLKINIRLKDLYGKYDVPPRFVLNYVVLDASDKDMVTRHGWLNFVKFNRPGEISAYIDYLIKNMAPYFQTIEAYRKHMMILLWCRQVHPTFRQIDKHILKTFIGWPSFVSKFLGQHTFQSAYEILHQRYLDLSVNMFIWHMESRGTFMAKKMWNLEVLNRIQANQKLLNFNAAHSADP